MSALSRNEHKSELPKPKVTVGKKFEPKPNSKMVPSYMRATTSSKKKTLSVRPKNTPGHHKGYPQALPSYMRPTSSSTTKQNAAIFKRPQTAKKVHRPKKFEKENVQPKTPEQPWPDARKEKDLSFKSALRAEQKREKITRRRTRVMPTMRSLELDFDQFIDIIDTEKNWGKLSKSDRDTFRVKKLQESIKSLIDELESLHLPNEDLSEALKDLADSYPKVKLEKFSHYWRLRVSNAIRCGRSKSDVFDLISTARKANAEPKIVIDEIYASTFEVYKNDSDLRKGTKQRDPEMTIIFNEELPEEHDQLELSIDFSPSKAESTLIRSSPKKMVRPKFNSMIEEATENSTDFVPVDLNSFMMHPKSQGSFYKLKKIKVNRDSKTTVLKPVRRSSRVAQQQKVETVNETQLDLTQLTPEKKYTFIENPNLPKEDQDNITRVLAELTL